MWQFHIKSKVECQPQPKITKQCWYQQVLNEKAQPSSVQTHNRHASVQQCMWLRYSFAATVYALKNSKGNNPSKRLLHQTDVKEKFPTNQTQLPSCKDVKSVHKLHAEDCI